MISELPYNRGLRPLRKVLSYAVGFAMLLMLGSSIARGQQSKEAEDADRYAGRQTAEALASLPASSRMVIDRLSSLSSLPVSEWRMHVGDLAHGESVNLDDSSWPLIRLPFETGSRDIVWLRARVRIPKQLHGYELAGASLRINSWKSDSITVYSNGQRVAAGDDLEPIVLFDSAKADDKALIAIRMGKTDDTKSLPEVNLQIEANSHRPSPAVLRTEFLCSALLIPQLTENVQRATDVLVKAIADVDIKALDAGDQERFDQSLRQSHNDLETIRTVLQKATLYLTGNSHIDTAWLWPWTETVDVVRRTFATTLQLMDEYPTFTFTQSAVLYNEWMAEKYPSLNEEIKFRIKEGRWEVVGGMWVEPDLIMSSGESQVRQLLIGQRTLESLYGMTAKIGWNPDSFGYNWQLPQIYKRSGIDYFVTQKMAWNETNPLPLKLFWWESPDGSRVLTYFPHSYGNENLDPVRLSNDLVNAKSHAPGLLDMMDLYGVGDHGGGVTRALLDQGLHWMEPGRVVPGTRFGTAESYFRAVEKKLSANTVVWNYQLMAHDRPLLPVATEGAISIPTWKDELYFEHHRGTYTTQANHKANMRNSEVWLLDAEEYSSFAWLQGETYPHKSINDAWKKALFNQFHDLAAGSGVGSIYVDAQKDYDEVRWATSEASTRALQAIQSRINTATAGDVPVLVFNPVGWKRSGVVEVDVQMPAAVSQVSVLDSKDRLLASQILSLDSRTNRFRLLVRVQDVPSMGYEVLHVAPGKRPFSSDLKEDGTTIENDLLKVAADPVSGCITSIYRKKARVESLASGACGNEIELFTDTPQGDDAWNIDPGTLDHYTALTKADVVKVIESGPLRSAIRVSRTWRNSRMDQDIVLYAGSDQVEVTNDIDWHETHVLMKVAFPLAASSRMATYEIPFGTIDRPTTRENSWDKAKFEVPALNWADLGDGKNGFSLINNSKYGYDCAGDVLRLTLLRSPVEPDPNADRGHHHFGFVLYPHAGDWKSALSIRRGYEYNNPMIGMQVAPHAGDGPLSYSFIALNQDNVTLTAVKKVEDANGILLRFYEWKGESGTVQIHVPPGAESATMTNLMEKPEGAPLTITNSGDVEVQFHPYEIVSVRVDYPQARK